MVEFKIHEFSGPLDLLLSLITEKKMEITEVAISGVTEQYLAYVDKMEEVQPEELADFLVIATKLLLLKSRMLLPHFSIEEEDGQKLEDQLRLYKAFVDASKKFNKLWLNDNRAGFRVEPPRKAEGFVWPANVTLEAMHGRMVQLIKRLKPLKPLPKTTIDRNISMKQKIDHIRKMLKSQKSVNFQEVLSNARNRTEVIVGFIALLELVKQRTVHLNQDSTFGDIVIKKV